MLFWFVPLQGTVTRHVLYIPSSFEVSDSAEIHEFMRSNSFAMLVTQGTSGMAATHLPMLLDTTFGPHGRLLGHMARANPHWRDPDGESLVIFAGPRLTRLAEVGLQGGSRTASVTAPVTAKSEAA